MARLDFWKLDWIFLAAALAVIGLGLPFLRSSASQAAFNRQLVWLAVGLAAMLFFVMVDYRAWIARAYWIYAASVALLGLVLFVAPVNNTNRYLQLGPVGMQPSELFKFALILALARHLGKRDNQDTLRGLAIPALLTLAPFFLILRQPDLGTAMTIPPILFAMIWVSGARLRHLGGAAALGLASQWPLWEFGMRPYQKARVFAFLRPELYETAEAYQMLMSLAVIGSGGVAGQGLGNGVITDLDLLPEKHNDFIFGVIAEEGGMAAAGSVILLFLLLTLVGLHIASAAGGKSGRLIAVGVSAILGWQALLNIYVVTGLFPTTGVTLPLVSYGGSSMVVSCAMIGLVLNVSQAPPETTFGD